MYIHLMCGLFYTYNMILYSYPAHMEQWALLFLSFILKSSLCNCILINCILINYIPSLFIVMPTMSIVSCWHHIVICRLLSRVYHLQYKWKLHFHQIILHSAKCLREIASWIVCTMKRTHCIPAGKNTQKLTLFGSKLDKNKFDPLF